MKTGMGNSTAEQTIQYPRKIQGLEEEEITRETELDLYYNSSGRIWHIFPHSHGNTKCLCGHKKRREHSEEHWHKKRTVEDILENPETGFGRISKPGLTQLQKQVQQE